MIHTIKQGDSLWLDITGTIDDVDTVWANWAGLWAIVPAIGGTATASGSLTKTVTTGKFRFNLPTAVSAALAVGEYFLILQVENTSVDYRQEIAQDRLTVKTQGITP